MYYVYVLKCGDGNYYKGCTKNLRERFNRHINGWVPADKKCKYICATHKLHIYLQPKGCAMNSLE
jgi:predicted GIY-YIG superfamily endonuclease